MPPLSKAACAPAIRAHTIVMRALLQGALVLASAGVGAWTATRNSSSRTDQQDYYKANLNLPDENEAPRARAALVDPWAPTTEPSLPAPPSAPSAPSQPTGTHDYTCDQVANKALALFRDQIEEQAADMRAAYAAIVQACNSKDWSDAGRACVIDATSLDAAEECM